MQREEAITKSLLLLSKRLNIEILDQKPYPIAPILFNLILLFYGYECFDCMHACATQACSVH